MDPMLTRILLTIFLWPMAMVLYIILFFLMERELRDDYAFIWAGLGVGFILCNWLILLWRRHLRWTRQRQWQTFLTIPAAIVLGCLVGFTVEWLGSYYGGMFAFFGSLIALVSWPIMVVLVWRESPEERERRAAVVSCPNCGYNLRGLSECRCPECGRQYTIDQLYAAQPRPTLERLHQAPR